MRDSTTGRPSSGSTVKESPPGHATFEPGLLPTGTCSTPRDCPAIGSSPKPLTTGSLAGPPSPPSRPALPTPAWSNTRSTSQPLHAVAGWAQPCCGPTGSTESDGIWTIQASVFPENEASLKLHLANGYVVVGCRRRIARMTHGPLTGQWRDTVLIERRSPAI